MLVTTLHNGQGLGNQLMVYVTTRCLAMDLGYDFGIQFPERFKGNGFMSLDFGKYVFGGDEHAEGRTPEVLPDGIKHYYKEKSTRLPNGTDVSDYDWNLRKLQDNTKIDGLMQGEDYFIHRRKEIKKWLQVEPIDLPDNVCILVFRGGEYAGVPAFFLPRQYWLNAMENMRKIRPDMEFRVVTDDMETARNMLPELPVSHEISEDYRKIHSAKYVILSNSTFGFFPAWTSDNLQYCIAPKYYGRHNVSDGYWCIEQNKTRGWWWQDREGNLEQL